MFCNDLALLLRVSLVKQEGYQVFGLPACIWNRERTSLNVNWRFGVYIAVRRASDGQLSVVSIRSGRKFDDIGLLRQAIVFRAREEGVEVTRCIAVSM